MNFKEFLVTEQYYATAEMRRGYAPVDVKIYKNSSLDEIKAIIKNTQNKELRIILDAQYDNIYFFDAYLTVHEDIAQFLEHELSLNWVGFYVKDITNIGSRPIPKSSIVIDNLEFYGNRIGGYLNHPRMANLLQKKAA